MPPACKPVGQVVGFSTIRTETCEIRHYPRLIAAKSRSPEPGRRRQSAAGPSSRRCCRPAAAGGSPGVFLALGGSV